MQDAARGLHLGGKDAQGLKADLGVFGEELMEVAAGDDLKACAGAGDGGERVGRVTEDAGKAEDGARLRLESEDALLADGVGGERDLAFVKQVDGVGGLTLAEERFIAGAEMGMGVSAEHGDQGGIGYGSLVRFVHGRRSRGRVRLGNVRKSLAAGGIPKSRTG